MTMNLAGVGAEVLDDECDDDRRAVVGVFLPRQSDAGLADVTNAGLGRWTRVGRRLRGPPEDDVVVCGRLDDERRTPCSLPGFTQRLARVPTRVTLPQLCTHPSPNHSQSTNQSTKTLLYSAILFRHCFTCIFIPAWSYFTFPYEHYHTPRL